jgi:hypothetical protein
VYEDPEVGATFTTGRTRPAVVAVIMTLFTLALVPQDFSYTRETLAAALFVHFLCLLCLFLAVRRWRLVLRPPSMLRLSPAGLTVRRGDRELTMPWNAVSQIRIEGDVRRPWVVAWVQGLDDVPASRRRDGAYKLFPVAHGQSVTKRGRRMRELREAIMVHGRRYLDDLV